MAQQTLANGASYGTQRTKINENFTELYSAADTVATEAERANNEFDTVAAAVAAVTASPTLYSQVRIKERANSLWDVVSGETADGVYILAAGSKQLMQAKFIDRMAEPDFNYAQNENFARDTQARPVKSALSDFSKRNAQQYEAPINSARIYIQSQSGAVVDFEKKLIPSPVDGFDIEFTIIREGTNPTWAIASQSISTTASLREFQLYITTATGVMTIIIGGTTYNTPDLRPFNNSLFRVRLTDDEDVLSVTKDGTLVYQNTAAISGTSVEPLANTLLLGRHNGVVGSYTSTSDAVLSDVIVRDRKRLVVLGASIMNGAFDDESATVAYMHEVGSELGDFSEYAVSGYTIDNLYAQIPTILAAHTEPCLFFMHVGGNDVTNHRPFSTAPYSALSNLRDKLKAIIDMVKADGHDFCLANLTYRNYSGMIDENDGSLPFNKSIHEPVIREYTPEWWDYENDAPVVDLYSWAKANTALMDPDGIHYTAAGYEALREYIISKISESYTNVNRATIRLDNSKTVGADLLTDYFYTNSTSDSAKLIGFNERHLYAGIGGASLSNFLSVDVEGVGTQMILKNMTATTFSGGDIVDGASLKQVFFDSSGVFTESSEPLPAPSRWKLINGGSLGPSFSKTFVRVS